MKTAFVTGATGFIGSTLVDDLILKGFKVKCAIRKSSNLLWLEGKDVELCQVDLFNQDNIKSALRGCDYIFHLAGVLFSQSEKEFIDGNVLTTQNLVSAAISLDKKILRFVYISSIVASGSSKTGQAMVETDPCSPFTWYGKSKWESEKLLLKYSDILPITIIRPGAVYGPRDYAMYTIFKLSKTGVNAILGERGKLGSVINVQDLVRGILESALSDRTIGETYFLANDDLIRQEEFGEAVIKAMGKRTLNILIPYKILDLASLLSELFGKITGRKVILNQQKLLEFREPYIICSNNKAKTDFGFQQKISFNEGISSTLKWYQDKNWL